MSPEAEDDAREFEPGLAGRVPVRNLFVLLLYASGLARFEAAFSGVLDELPERAEGDLRALLARMLVFAVRHRLRRNLSRGYVGRAADLTRVRGRIDLARTVAGGLLERGRVACRFEELTLDTPRNRLVRAALAYAAARIADAGLAAACRGLARDLEALGVGAGLPSRAELSRDVIGRNDAHDLLMVSVAKLLVAPELPWSRPGARALGTAGDDLVFWKIYETAVARILELHLPGRVKAQSWRPWPLAEATAGAAALWPRLSPDIVVRRADGSAPLVIDTKFTSMTERHYALERFKTAHLYQMLAYLATDPEMAGGRAEGLLLYPRIGGEPAEEAATVRGYRMRLATVDLAAEPRTIVDRIVGLAEGESRGAAAGRNAGFSAGGGAFARMADCEPV